MKKFYTTFAAVVITLSAIAGITQISGSQKPLQNKDIKKEMLQMKSDGSATTVLNPFDKKNMTKSPKQAGPAKAVAISELEGEWNASWSGLLTSISGTHEEEVTVTWSTQYNQFEFNFPSWGLAPFYADYDPATATFTFGQDNFGSYAGNLLFHIPLNGTSTVNSISVKYDEATKTIDFGNYGLAAAAVDPSSYSLLGYYWAVNKIVLSRPDGDYSLKVNVQDECTPDNKFSYTITKGADIAEIYVVTMEGDIAASDFADYYQNYIKLLGESVQPGTYTIEPEAEMEDGTGYYSIMAFGYDSNGNLVKKAHDQVFVVMNEDNDYQTIGTIYFDDQLVNGYYNNFTNAKDVEIQENVNTPGVYRLVDAYAGQSASHSSSCPHYIYLDAQDPEFVNIPASNTGLDFGDGILVYGTFGGALGYSKEQCTAQGYAVGSLNERTITFPTRSVLAHEKGYNDPGSWSYMNANNEMTITLPDLLLNVDVLSQDDTDTPLEGVTVSVATLVNGEADEVIDEQTTAADGKVTFSLPTTVDYLATVRVTVTDANGQTATQDVKLNGANNAQTMRLELAAEEPVNTTPIYLMGSGNGLSWETFPGMEVLPGEDGTYNFTIENLSSFKMSTKKAAGWDGDFNDEAFGYSGAFGDAVFNAEGMTVALEPWGENQDMPYPGSYTININDTRSSMTVKANFEKPVAAPEVFVRGAMNGWGGNPGDAWKFENTAWDGTSGTWTWTGTINANQEFKIADANWGNINYSTNGTITVFNQPLNLTYNQQNSKFAETFVGTITLEVTNYTGHQATATFATEGEASFPETMYVFGNVNGKGISPDNGVAMTVTDQDNGIYTIENVLVGNEMDSGYGYIGFAEKLSDSASDWSTLNAYRFGPATADEPIEATGEYTVTFTDYNSFKVPADNYMTMTLDVKNMKLTVTAMTTEEPAVPELPDNIDVTYDFSTYENIQSYVPGMTGTIEQEWQKNGTTSYYYNFDALTSNGIVITGDKGTCTSSQYGSRPYINMIQSSKSMTFRTLKGNTVTFSAPEGYTIKSIIFAGTSASYVSYFTPAEGQVGTMAASTLSEGDNKYINTWTAPETGTVNSITFDSPGAAIVKTIQVVAEKVGEEPETPSIPEGAYVVYNNGVVNPDLKVYGWWAAGINFTAANPDGEGETFEFKADNGGAAASMGINMEAPQNTGILHNATLNFNWYATTAATYTVRLTSVAEENYQWTVTEDQIGKWNTVSLNVAETFPTVATQWDANTNLGVGYVFSIIMDGGTEDSAIYFDQIYYTNVDNEWEAPVVVIPAPETVPAPAQAADDVFSFFSSYGDNVSNNIGGWGQSTQLQTVEIDGKDVYFLRNFNYLGLVDFNINVADYDYMHVDYWTNSENTPFGFVPISLNPTVDTPIWEAPEVKANEWNSYDAPLAGFNADMSKIEQLKFVANLNGNPNTEFAYIANVYFWKETKEQPGELSGTANMTAQLDMNQGMMDEPELNEPETYQIPVTYADGKLTFDSFADCDETVVFDVTVETGVAVAAPEQVAYVDRFEDDGETYEFTYYYGDVETGTSGMVAEIFNVEGEDYAAMVVAPWGEIFADSDYVFFNSAYFNTTVILPFAIEGLPTKALATGEATYTLCGPIFADGSTSVEMKAGEEENTVTCTATVWPQNFYITKTVDGVETKIQALTDADAANQVTAFGTYLGAEESGIDWVLSAVVAENSGSELRFTFNTVDLTLKIESATGVELVGAEEGEVVYYNLQGVRVDNPAAGQLLIKVVGNKASKVVVK